MGSMDVLVETHESLDAQSESVMQVSQFHSVEFSISGLDLSYQFRLWNKDPEPMHVIVREDSDLLRWLKIGKRFNFKYYSNELSCVVEPMETEIVNIAKADEGRFKGHYIVSLLIVAGINKIRTHLDS